MSGDALILSVTNAYYAQRVEVLAVRLRLRNTASDYNVLAQLMRQLDGVVEVVLWQPITSKYTHMEART
jgi:hypothetical protein